MVSLSRGFAKFMSMVLAGTSLTVPRLAIPSAPAQEAGMKIALRWRPLPPIPDRDAWSPAGEAPFSRGTVPTAVWGRQVVIPNGEARPGYRSPEVWSLQIDVQR